MLYFPLPLLATLIGALAALVAAPLTVMVFYLRALRDDSAAAHAASTRRVDRLESAVQRLERGVDEIHRAYTTKDDWLRESMLARAQLERMSEILARLAADIENVRTLAAQFGRASNAIVEMADHLLGRGASGPLAPPGAGSNRGD